MSLLKSNKQQRHLGTRTPTLIVHASEGAPNLSITCVSGTHPISPSLSIWHSPTLSISLHLALTHSLYLSPSGTHPLSPLPMCLYVLPMCLALSSRSSRSEAYVTTTLSLNLTLARVIARNCSAPLIADAVAPPPPPPSPFALTRCLVWLGNVWVWVACASSNSSNDTYLP